MPLFGRQLALSPPPRLQRVTEFEAEGDGARSGDINLDNVLRLIPGEVVPLFIAGTGIAGVTLSWIDWKALVFWICFAICALLRALASQPQGARGLRGINWRLVVVTLVAFFLWAHAVSGTPAQGQVSGGPLITFLPSPAWGFFAMAFSIGAPKLVPAQT
jgi:hypothetical protein